MLEAGKIVGIPRYDVPALVDLKNGLIDRASEDIESGGIAVRAPIQKTGDPELHICRKARTQVSQKRRIADETVGACVEIHLHPFDVVSGRTPVGEGAQELHEDLRRPSKRFSPHHEPDCGASQVRHRRAPRLKVDTVAFHDLTLEQVDPLGPCERRLRANAGP